MRPRRVDNFGTYFVSSATANRRRLFQVERYARLFIEVLLHYRDENKYLVHEFVGMPDHFHAIITPNEITIERAMQFIKGGFSYRIRQMTSGEIWQRGFTDHRIRDAADYAQHRDYIWMNPVRARLCLEPHQYAYASASGLFLLDAPPQRLKPSTMAASERLG